MLPGGGSALPDEYPFHAHHLLPLFTFADNALDSIQQTIRTGKLPVDPGVAPLHYIAANFPDPARRARFGRSLHGLVIAIRVESSDSTVALFWRQRWFSVGVGFGAHDVCHM